jgi:hypothetical protein
MYNSKIKAVNAPALVRHLQTLSKLSTKENESPYPFDLLGELYKLERKANRITTAQCNGEGNEQAQEKQLNTILTRVNSLLKVKTAFINGDPRGYALKLKEEEAKELGIYTDWGGYGILAPEF